MIVITDWSTDWVFSDSRFNLIAGTDEQYRKTQQSSRNAMETVSVQACPFLKCVTSGNGAGQSTIQAKAVDIFTDGAKNGTDFPIITKMVRVMTNTKTFLGLIAGAAAGAVVYILAASSKSSTAISNKAADEKGEWKENTTDSFTGWLERLKLAIDKEVKH